VNAPTVQVLRLRDGAALPVYATAGAAGLDLFAAEGTALAPGARGLVGTGIALQIPAGWEGQVRPRSGLAARHGVTVLNAPGTIDSDYRGEIRVLLVNLGEEPFVVRPGDRVAQLVVAPVARVELVATGELSSTTRGAGGFGHTGT
jgi:dUTP pyrophosphatase